MKTIKFLLVLLLVMLGTTAFAQGVVVHKTDGTTEVIHDVDSVVYETSAIGYYSFNATSTAEIKNLTATDFTKLNAATSEVNCGVTGLITVLTTGTTAPIAWKRSEMDGQTYGEPITLNKAGTFTIEINNKTYNVWYWAGATNASDNKKVKIQIN